MAKLKVGKGRDGSGKNKRKKKVVEEITLSSGSESESSDSEVMEVDETENGQAEPESNGTKDTPLETNEDSTEEKPANNVNKNNVGDGDEEMTPVESAEAEKPVKNGTEAVNGTEKVEGVNETPEKDK